MALTIPFASAAQGTNRGTHDTVSKRARGTRGGPRAIYVYSDR
ncbi:hypothetical protein [Anaerobiospirillum succiniciproducens]|nr:hypothetical protein [Anaerobiospirillum succiniciproducens]